MQSTRKMRGPPVMPKTALGWTIYHALQRNGLSAYGACKIAGVERTTIRDIWRKGSTPSADRVGRLKNALGLEWDELIPRPKPITAVEPPPTSSLPNGTISLRRQGDLAFDGITADQPVATIWRPTILSDRVDSYAIYVADDLNAPIIQAGHVAYVDPSRPCVINHPLRIFPRLQAAFIGTLGRSDAEFIEVRVSAEADARRYSTSDVPRMERVVAFTMLDI